MNPCPCGYLFDPSHECTCTDVARQRYISRISGPLLDRIDLCVKVDPLGADVLIDRPRGYEEPSSAIRARVNKARAIQLERFAGTGIVCNAQMSPRMVRTYCELSEPAKDMLRLAFKSMSFSARANDKILRTARTIADLAGSEEIESQHISEAIQFKRMDITSK